MIATRARAYALCNAGGSELALSLSDISDLLAHVAEAGFPDEEFASLIEAVGAAAVGRQPVWLGCAVGVLMSEAFDISDTTGLRMRHELVRRLVVHGPLTQQHTGKLLEALSRECELPVATLLKPFPPQVWPAHRQSMHAAFIKPAAESAAAAGPRPLSLPAATS